MNTVTIPIENTLVEDEATKQRLLFKIMSCSCGWAGRARVYQSEIKAKHHLLYTHGEGRIQYGRVSELVGVEDRA
jgi:hypothetical protein